MCSTLTLIVLYFTFLVHSGAPAGGVSRVTLSVCLEGAACRTRRGAARRFEPFEIFAKVERVCNPLQHEELLLGADGRDEAGAPHAALAFQSNPCSST